jgi:uncharacterized membrane protein
MTKVRGTDGSAAIAASPTKASEIGKRAGRRFRCAEGSKSMVEAPSGGSW